MPGMDWDVFHGGTAIELLNDTACTDLAQRLLTLSGSWQERHALDDQIHSFHTLGAATYLDTDETYGPIAAKANPILRDSFGDLLDQVGRAIAERTGHPVQLSEDLALPGFHIFRGDQRAPPGLMYGGTIHVDCPHDRHKFPFTIEGTLSLTLPIRIPACGAGMYHWADVPAAMMTGPKAPHAMSPAQRDWYDTHKQFIGYTAGAMVLHDGLTVHQLANPGRTQDDEYRISLQGHGVLGGGAWHLFF
jgi:hypothetical protein